MVGKGKYEYVGREESITAFTLEIWYVESFATFRQEMFYVIETDSLVRRVLCTLWSKDRSSMQVYT